MRKVAEYLFVFFHWLTKIVRYFGSDSGSVFQTKTSSAVQLAVLWFLL